MNPATTSPAASRLSDLRRRLEERGLDWYLVLSQDPHLSEYVPAWWLRREYLTDFTGSAGFAVVGRTSAQLWADSRYWLQAESEVDSGCFELVRMGAPDVPEFTEWLARHVAQGAVVGVDPQVVSLEQERKWRKALGRAGARLELVEGNLVDAIWSAQPERSASPVMIVPTDVSGEAPAKKLARLQEALREAGTTLHPLTMLDAVAWLFDLRGSDVEYNPVFVAACLVRPDSATLFIDEAKLDAAARAHLPQGVEVRPYDELGAALAQPVTDGKAWVDPATCSSWIAARLTTAGWKLHEERSPVTLFKARKNEAEMAGARACHVRDGVAVVRFLAWLGRSLAAGDTLTEVSAAERLAAFRAEGERFRGLSFPSISSYAAHGAIVHYRPGPATDCAIGRDSLYLIDSGGQYLDGTTDITRTTCFGTPTAEQVDRFTRVLRGHVALARARFPVGTTGKHLDALARLPLWDEGLDYGHGTGHGVGAYLNVHEGPQGISQKSADVPLDPGMILSNEPGWYADGRYGIRIESLVIVRPVAEAPIDGRKFLEFETITLCPIDQALIDVAALLPAERAWLDAYHARVRATLAPLLPAEDREWLERATTPLRNP